LDVRFDAALRIYTTFLVKFGMTAICSNNSPNMIWHRIRKSKWYRSHEAYAMLVALPEITPVTHLGTFKVFPPDYKISGDAMKQP
jgi:hypothetical protein